MKTLATYFLCAAIAVLPGCGALEALRQGPKNDQFDSEISKLRDGVQQLSNTVEEVRVVQKQARQQADADGDGKLSGTELLTYGGLVAAGLGELARRKLKALDAKHAESAAHREELEARVEHEREKRKDAYVADLEAQVEALKARLK